MRVKDSIQNLMETFQPWDTRQIALPGLMHLDICMKVHAQVRDNRLYKGKGGDSSKNLGEVSQNFTTTFSGGPKSMGINNIGGLQNQILWNHRN